jgi:hypothetical protein
MIVAMLSTASRPRLLPLLLVLAAAVLSPAVRAEDDPAPPDAKRVRVDGLWCGAGFLRGTSLTLTQHHHAFEGTLERGDRTRNVDGRIEGTILRTSAASAGRAGRLVLNLEGDALRIMDAGGPLALIQGMSFFRASGPGC